MKHIKTEILAILAAMALTASLGAGNASATALEVNGWGEDEPVTIEANLKSGTSTALSRTDGLLLNTCTASTVKGDTESPFTGTTVTGAVDTLTFSSCTKTVTVDKAGILHIEHIAGTTNGTVSWSGAEVTTGSPFGTLNCKTGEGVDIGTLTGTASGAAELHINAVLNCGFLVPSAKWEGTYTVASPEALGVVKDPDVRFRSTASPVVFYGVQSGAGQSNEWKMDNAATTCKKASYETKSITTPTSALVLTPTFSECTVLGYAGGETELNMEECQFELLQPNVSMEGNVAIRCTGGNSIKFFGDGVAGDCEARVGQTENTNLAKAKYINLGGNPSQFEVKITLSGITVDRKLVPLFCGLKEVGVMKTGTFTANVILEGKSGIGVSVK